MPLSHEHIGSKILVKIKIYILTKTNYFLPYAMRYPVDDTDKAIGLMKIADKYNFSNLYDAIDSQLAQEIQRIIWSHYGKNNLKKLTEYVRFCEETGAPKLSAAIFY